MSLFEKFPPILKDNLRVVWDTRQEETGVAEFLVYDKNTSPEFLSVLEARARRNQASRIEFLAEGVSEFLKTQAIRQWGEASKKLKVLAVTGTNGKSTTVSLLRYLICQQGSSCAEVGTLGVSLYLPRQKTPSQQLETGFTTPDCHQLHYLFHQLLGQKMEYVAIEVSSHAIALDRIRGVKFTGAIFTNLTQDHLDFHKTMHAYEEAKLKLFTDYLDKESVAVINQQGEVGKRFFQKLQNAPSKVFSFSNPESYSIESARSEGLTIKIKNGPRFNSPLAGAYNAENIVGALELLAELGIGDRNSLAASLENFTGVCGRLERVSPNSKSIGVFVDYAHTPDALEKALLALKNVKDQSGKLFCVFGCGGNRDPGKRPLMGKIASQIADGIIVTSDNPRNEEPAAIISDILKGIDRDQMVKVLTIVDRKEAILKALGLLKPKDLLLIAGKGHEQYQIIGATQSFFSDQAVVADYFESS